MENIEKEFRRDNLPAACIQAKKAAKVIAQNRSGLNRLEPDYNWKEIEKVLLDVPRKFCSQDVKVN